MNFKKIFPKLLSIAFLAMLVLPLSAGAKDINTKAKNNEGCRNFSTVKSDNCESGLICEIVNFDDPKFAGKPIASEGTNCSTSSTVATGGACDGACISVSDQGFGLDASNFGRAGLSQSKDLKGTIARIINIALGFLGIIAVVFILMGGFKMMTAAGNEDQTADGKKAVMGGVIGLIIIFAAWGIASFVISSLQSSTAGAPAPAPTGRCIYDNDADVDSNNDGNKCNDATLSLIGSGAKCENQITDQVCLTNKGACPSMSGGALWDVNLNCPQS